MEQTVRTILSFERGFIDIVENDGFLQFRLTSNTAKGNIVEYNTDRMELIRLSEAPTWQKILITDSGFLL